jgi:hypothetical protein
MGSPSATKDLGFMKKRRRKKETGKTQWEVSALPKRYGFGQHGKKEKSKRLSHNVTASVGSRAKG